MGLDEHKGEKNNQRFLERCFRLLEYLRKNTDNEHTLTQAELRKSEICHCLGNNETFNRTVTQLARALNCENDTVKPKDDWVLVYRAFAECYGDNVYDDDRKMSSSVKDIYFNHIFTDAEMTAIINALRTSKAVNRDEAERIIGKLKDRLAPDFYKEPPYKLDSSEFFDSPMLAENIVTIQRAISEEKKVSYAFNYYNQRSELVRTRAALTVVSPYYIVSSEGRLYLIGVYDDNVLCVNRIDLMTDMEILNQKRIAFSDLMRSNMRDMPPEMSEEFKIKHLNMSYETPIAATFRSTKRRDDGDPDLTFIHDYFGSNFTVTDPKENIIRVRCSEWGVVNFAVQYGDYVEVLDDNLREKIAERIKHLSETYL